MLTVLFWNIQKKPLLDRVARTARAHAVDVVVLAECTQTDAELLTALNGERGKKFVCPRRFTDKFRIAFSSPIRRLPPVRDTPGGYVSVYEAKFRTKPPLLLTALHLPSKQAARESLVQQAADELRRTEVDRGISTTVAFGDFNRSPFDDVMVDALGFHALMTRTLAGRRHWRTVAGTEYPTFFNPMWEFLTDRGDRPAGTYYFHESVPTNHFWYALDQVLVRPELVGKLSAVEILESDGVESLLHSTHRWPDETVASDHLPLLFRLDW